MISLIFISSLFSCQDAVCSLIPTAPETVQMLSAPADSGYHGRFASHEASDAFLSLLGETRQPSLTGPQIEPLPLGPNYVPHATQMWQVPQYKPFEGPVGQAAPVPLPMANDDVHRWNSNGEIGQPYYQSTHPYYQVTPRSYYTRASRTDHIGPYSDSWNTQGLPAAIEMYYPLLHPGQHHHVSPLAAHRATSYSPQVQDESYYTNLLRHPGNLGIFHENSEHPVMLDELSKIFEKKISQTEASHVITPGNTPSETKQSHFVTSTIQTPIFGPSTLESNFIYTSPSSGFADHASSWSFLKPPYSSVHESEPPSKVPHNNDRYAYVTHEETAGTTTGELKKKRKEKEKNNNSLNMDDANLNQQRSPNLATSPSLIEKLTVVSPREPTVSSSNEEKNLQKSRRARSKKENVDKSLNPPPARFPTQSAPREPEVTTPSPTPDPLPTPDIQVEFSTEIPLDYWEGLLSSPPPWPDFVRDPKKTPLDHSVMLSWNIENFQWSLMGANKGLLVRLRKLFAFLWKAQEAAIINFLPKGEENLLEYQKHGFTYLASLVKHPKVAIKNIVTKKEFRPALTITELNNPRALSRLIQYLTYRDNATDISTVGLQVLLAWTRDFFPELEKKLHDPDPITTRAPIQDLTELVQTARKRFKYQRKKIGNRVECNF